MAKQKTNNNVSIWSFRREITLGTLLHLTALVIVLTAGWSNLQKELALIQHDLSQLITANDQLQKNIGILTDQIQNHEYRLKALERENQPYAKNNNIINDKIFYGNWR